MVIEKIIKKNPKVCKVMINKTGSQIKLFCIITQFFPHLYFKTTSGKVSKIIGDFKRKLFRLTIQNNNGWKTCLGTKLQGGKNNPDSFVRTDSRWVLLYHCLIRSGTVDHQ